MARKLVRDCGTKVIPESGELGFPLTTKKGSKDEMEVRFEQDKVEDVARCGYRKLPYALDPHDRERNPRGGLREQTQDSKDEIDRDNDHDED
jgi:hypothetical protein